MDYLANGAEALREALAQDAEATRKLADALKIFGEMEEKTKALLRAKLSSRLRSPSVHPVPIALPFFSSRQ